MGEVGRIGLKWVKVGFIFGWVEVGWEWLKWVENGRKGLKWILDMYGPVSFMGQN